MPALGIGALWAGYTIGLWGYCLIKGYDVRFSELLSSVWPPPVVRGDFKDMGKPIGRKPTDILK